MRSVRSEMLYALEALAIPIAVAMTFPYGAIGFSAKAERPPAPVSSAFACLDQRAIEKVLAATRGTWKDGADESRRLRPDLFVGELPEAEAELVFPVGVPAIPSEPTLVPRGRTPFLPSARAAAPVALKRDGATKEPLPFLREELLKID